MQSDEAREGDRFRFSSLLKVSHRWLIPCLMPSIPHPTAERRKQLFHHNSKAQHRWFWPNMAARGWLPSPMRGNFFGGFFFDGNKRLFNHFIENPKLDAMLHLHYKFMSYKFLNLRTCPIPDCRCGTHGIPRQEERRSSLTRFSFI